MRQLVPVVLLFVLIPTAFSATIRVPADYPTIQGAIDAAVGGDAVLVAPGTYREVIRIIDKGISVRGARGRAGTVIDGMEQPTVVLISSEDAVLLAGFTICNGGSHGAYHTGISVRGSAPHRIMNNRITGNGRGVECESPALISGNTIENNNGAGIFCRYFVCRPVISGNRILGNRESGIQCTHASRVTILNNLIARNENLRWGGGIRCSGSAPCRISGNAILDNHDNGIFCFDQKGGGEPFTLTDNIVAGNVSERQTGGIECFLPQVVLAGNTIAFNISKGGTGGLVIHQGTTGLKISNTIMWGNRGPRSDDLFVTGNSTSGIVKIRHSILKGCQDELSSGIVSPGMSLQWGPGMIDADPLLVDPLSKDYHLSWDSPCRDAGDNGSAVWGSNDFEGDPRIAGARVDIGADEFYFRLYHTGDVSAGGTTTMRIVGPPTAPVRLALGSSFDIGGVRTPYGRLFIGRPPYPAACLPGTISSRGVLTFPLPVPATASPGDLFPLQALVGPPGVPWTRLTNLHVLEVD